MLTNCNNFLTIVIFVALALTCTKYNYKNFFTNVLVALKRASFGTLSGGDIMRADITLQCGAAD